MEEKIDFSQIPYHYPLCLNKECPKANTCLRQIIAQNIPANVESWVFLCPGLHPDSHDNCPRYSSNVKARYAKGFIKLLEKLPYTQMQTVISRLISLFGQRTYYRVRKGERLLSPAEQKKVLSILQSCGVSLPLDFDDYVEAYVW